MPKNILCVDWKLAKPYGIGLILKRLTREFSYFSTPFHFKTTAAIKVFIFVCVCIYINIYILYRQWH